MKTTPDLNVFAVANPERFANINVVPFAEPIELDLTTLRLVGGGLPRSGWGSNAVVTEQTDLPRAGW